MTKGDQACYNGRMVVISMNLLLKEKNDSVYKRKGISRKNKREMKYTEIWF